jgi:hypothetical protein
MQVAGSRLRLLLSSSSKVNENGDGKGRAL